MQKEDIERLRMTHKRDIKGRREEGGLVVCWDTPPKGYQGQGG